MWHEARKQERKIRGMLSINYRQRAERRKNFYEKIKADPTQFMQIHGRKCKIEINYNSLDPSTSSGESSSIMMPWQGQLDNLIDRFDVRAHLDFIPPMYKPSAAEEELTSEERQANYERYRILAQNDFIGISEEKFLNQLYLEEQFGVNAQLEMEKAKPKSKSGGVAIGYTYDDETPYNASSSVAAGSSADPDDLDDSDSDVDVDVAIDITKMDTAQANELNTCGRGYGMKSNDFYSFLTNDADEAENLRLLREEEAEKILLSGRKSRRERRAQREKRLPGRISDFNIPSYAAKEEEPESRLNDDKEEDDSRSEDEMPDSGKVVFITSFGGEEELKSHSKISINFNAKNPASKYPGNTLGGISYAEKVKQNLEKLKKMNDSSRPKRSRSRSRSRRRYGRRRSRDRYRSRRSRSRSRSNRRSHRHSSSSRSRSPVVAVRRKSPPPPQPKAPPPQIPALMSLDIKPKIESIKALKRIARSRSRSLLRETKETPPVIPATTTVELVQPKEEPASIKRYYGRRKEDQTSSESECEEESPKSGENAGKDVDGNQSPKSVEHQLSSFKAERSSSSSSFLGKQTAPVDTADSKAGILSSSKSSNPRDRLKKKMQILLNKQFRADKKAEIERTERQNQQQQEREEEMRELALKLRRRQRELRHKYGHDIPANASKSRSPSKSKSKSRTPPSRSRSPTPKPKKPSRRSSRDYVIRRSPRRYYRRSRSPSASARRPERNSRSRSRERRNRDRRRDSRSTDRDRHRSRRTERKEQSARSSRKLVDY